MSKESLLVLKQYAEHKCNAADVAAEDLLRATQRAAELRTLTFWGCEIDGDPDPTATYNAAEASVDEAADRLARARLIAEAAQEAYDRAENRDVRDMLARERARQTQSEAQEQAQE